MKVCVLQGCSSFYISFTKVCLIKQLSWGYMLSYQSNNAESDRACSNLMKPFFLIISQHNLTKVVSHITCTLYISTSTILFHAQLIFLTFFFFTALCITSLYSHHCKELMSESHYLACRWPLGSGHKLRTVWWSDPGGLKNSHSSPLLTISILVNRAAEYLWVTHSWCYCGSWDVVLARFNMRSLLFARKPLPWSPD